MSTAFLRYSSLLSELFQKRQLGAVSDDEEERFAGKLHDCRVEMEPGEEDQIDGIIEQQRLLAKAKAAGIREGLTVAILAIDGLMSDGCDQSGHDIPADCYECVAALRALLPPAPSEAKGPTSKTLDPAPPTPLTWGEQIVAGGGNLFSHSTDKRKWIK